ncbi:MAG TPA: hypothetical protein PLO24_06000 [Bacteroidales bacterium]|jgi:hypothetical protein|nr:hypothetical protein [Bacteroidales bacterium]HQH24265.1 hypothetical protein [Bacteroidales bacterium]HQJ81501.1 hypothetical protein [Bacteroidales bacterium]
MNLYRSKRLAVSFSFLLLSCTVSFSHVPEGLCGRGNGAEVSFPAPLAAKKPGRIRKPVSAARAIRKQKAEERKRDREYLAQLKADQKRHFEIQSPEVRERMRQNNKDTETRYKAKKKAVVSKNKKAGRKYR